MHFLQWRKRVIEKSFTKDPLFTAEMTGKCSPRSPYSIDPLCMDELIEAVLILRVNSYLESDLPLISLSMRGISYRLTLLIFGFRNRSASIDDYQRWNISAWKNSVAHLCFHPRHNCVRLPISCYPCEGKRNYYIVIDIRFKLHCHITNICLWRCRTT